MGAGLADPARRLGPALSGRASPRGRDRLRRDFRLTPPRRAPASYLCRGAGGARALATALATAGLLPPVSPGKRSAACGHQRGRARASGSAERKTRGAVEDRGLCRCESHSALSCLSPRRPGDRRPGGAVRLREPTRRGRALRERGRPGCPRAALAFFFFLAVAGPLGKRLPHFSSKKNFAP